MLRLFTPALIKMATKRTQVLAMLCCALLAGLPTTCEAEKIPVSASITPLYNLLTELLPAESFEVRLIIPPHCSPHEFYMQPSQMQWLEKSRLIVWVGPSLEQGLIKRIQKLKQTSKARPLQVFTLTQDAGLKLLPSRHTHTTDLKTSNHSAEHTLEPIDPHVWLSPQATRTLLQNISAWLIQQFPNERPGIQQRTQQLDAKLKSLDEKFKSAAPQLGKFYVYHDAYQYLENHYQLPSMGPMVLHPEMPLSPQQIARISAQIKTQGIQCLFTEPQFNTKFLQKLQSLHPEQTFKILSLDPLGIPHQSHATTLENLLNQFLQCPR